MLSTIERLQLLINNSGEKATHIMAKLELSTNAFSEWKKGKAKPSTEAIIKLSQYFGVTTDYLLLGKEPDNTCTPLISTLDRELLVRFHQLNHAQQERCIGYIDGMLAESKKTNEISTEKMAEK